MRTSLTVSLSPTTIKRQTTPVHLNIFKSRISFVCLVLTKNELLALLARSLVRCFVGGLVCLLSNYGP